jgi:hypothetical protein
MRKQDKTAEAYKAIKAALKANRENVKYFTLAFYKTYMQCRAKADDNNKAGIDDSYIRPGERFKRFHAWDDVYNSDFYNKNSAAYCQFLEFVN